MGEMNKPMKEEHVFEQCVEQALQFYEAANSRAWDKAAAIHRYLNHAETHAVVKRLATTIFDKERELAEARVKIDDLTATDIHSCHPKCKRPACVARRERDEAREQRDALAVTIHNLRSEMEQRYKTHFGGYRLAMKEMLETLAAAEGARQPACACGKCSNGLVAHVGEQGMRWVDCPAKSATEGAPEPEIPKDFYEAMDDYRNGRGSEMTDEKLAEDKAVEEGGEGEIEQSADVEEAAVHKPCSPTSCFQCGHHQDYMTHLTNAVRCRYPSVRVPRVEAMTIFLHGNAVMPIKAAAVCPHFCSLEDIKKATDEEVGLE